MYVRFVVKPNQMLPALFGCLLCHCLLKLCPRFQTKTGAMDMSTYPVAAPVEIASLNLVNLLALVAYCYFSFRASQEFQFYLSYLDYLNRSPKKNYEAT